tara:strand:+ start:1911 stop:2741 length:831 start_codon:yes stop_codon:yes gene_type:complete
MRIQPATLFVMGFALSIFCVNENAMARSVVGSESSAAEEEKADEKKGQQADDAKTKAADEAAAKKQKEQEEKEKKEEEARLKAEQAAKEAALKKEAEAAKKKQEAKMQERRKQREKRDGILAQVKTRRNYVREFNGHKALVMVTPGGAEKNNVIEVTFQVHKMGEDSNSLAQAKVLKKLGKATATVGQQKRRRGSAETYKLHRISRAGTYGFHYTPTMAGTFRVDIKIDMKDGQELTFDIPLYVGIWPPPDFPQEEEAYQNATQGQSRNRRIMSLD